MVVATYICTYLSTYYTDRVSMFVGYDGAHDDAEDGDAIGELTVAVQRRKHKRVHTYANPTFFISTIILYIRLGRVCIKEI